MGTRPELIRFSRLISEIKKDKRFRLSIIHTGQHYSFGMDAIFFSQLKLPEPDINLNIGPVSPNKQMSLIIDGLDQLFDKQKTDLVCVWGDTNSSLAAAIAAAKRNLPVAHIEAGYRSFDLRMPEELNRTLIDHCSTLLFPFCDDSEKNLIKESVKGKIIKVDNPLIEVFRQNSSHYPATDIINKYKLSDHFLIFTTHRAENVDNPATLRKMVNSIIAMNKCRVVFPVHPRTQKLLTSLKLTEQLKTKGVIIIDPVGYFEMLDLIHDCEMVVTDSGGLQVEAFFAHKPCLTIRRSTEWTKTVSFGTNFLVDPEKEDILKTINSIYDRRELIVRKFKQKDNPYGRGNGVKQVIQSFVNFIK